LTGSPPAGRCTATNCPRTAGLVGGRVDVGQGACPHTGGGRAAICEEHRPAGAPGQQPGQQPGDPVRVRFQQRNHAGGQARRRTPPWRWSAGQQDRGRPAGRRGSRAARYRSPAPRAAPRDGCEPGGVG
jgi:hypothetical protein